MTKPTGKSGKGRNQRKKPNKGNATMTNYFPTEKKPAQGANNSGKTTGTNHDDDASVASVASNESNNSKGSNTSSGSNNSYAGAVKNTNSTAPTNLDEKLAGTSATDDENWTTVSNKSPPRNSDKTKRNRVATPARKEKTDTTTTKAAKKLGSPMKDKDNTPQRPNKLNVVTEEKPKNPNQKSYPTTGKKPEVVTKDPNPVASPPELGRNPQPAVEAALKPEANTGKPDKAAAPTKNPPTSTKKNKNNNKNKKNKKQVEFKVEPYAINTKAPATLSYMTLLTKIGDSKPLTEEELKTNILTEVQTFFVEEKNVKTIFPTEVKDMDRKMLKEFLTEAMRKKSRIRGPNSLATRGTTLIRYTIQSLSLLTVKDMKKFPNWDESKEAFTGHLTEMEKMVVAALDLLGPIPWIRQKPKPGKQGEKKTEKATATEPTLTPAESAKAIIQNPYAKAKQKSTTPNLQTKRYRLIGELRTPVHEGWDPKDFPDKNKVISEKFQQLVGVMRNTDDEVIIQPYITEKTLGKLSAPAKPIDERTKQFPRNSWQVGDYIDGTFHSSGQSSIVQCCISTTLKPEDFVKEFNKLGEELDEEDKWMMTLHPIQTMETTNLAFLQGTTRYTDVTQLGRAINEKLNKLQSTTNKTYIHVKSQNIFINAEERQSNWNKPREAHPYTPASHIICAVEDYHTLLPLVLQIYNPAKKSGFPLEIKYALIVASETKSFRGNRIEVEATVRIARENQYKFLNDVRSIPLCDVLLGDPHTPLHDQLPEVTTHSLIIGLKETPRGYGLFLGCDRDSHRPNVHHLTYAAHNHARAIAVANALGLVLVHKLGQIVWRGFTDPFKINQTSSYIYDAENNKYITREEQLVRATWKNDQLAHREIKNSRNEECLVAGTALEVNALQAYAARTVIRKSGQATASVSPTEFDMQTYQESLLDIFDEEIQEDLNDDDDDDDDDDKDEDDDDADDEDENGGDNATEKEKDVRDEIMQDKPALQNDTDSISLDSPPKPGQESHYPIPANVTIQTTNPELDTTCTLDHESPGFVHEGTRQRTQHPTQEQREWTYHILELSRVTEYWKTTTDLDGDPGREKARAAITEWAYEEERQKDPAELDPGEHITWVTNAYLYFNSCNEEKRQQAEDILKYLATEPDTRYDLTALARNTRIAQVPPIDATIDWTPTVPIPDVTGRPELDVIQRKIQGSWLLTHEHILTESIVEFLLALSMHAKIPLEHLLNWIETNGNASEAAQVMIIRHWQNWMYYTQFSDEELPLLEQNVHPHPVILNLREAQRQLLNLDHILTQSYIQPVNRAEDEEY